MEKPEQPCWTAERLERIINDQIEEGPQLDYKAAASIDRNESTKTEITKDVSAFANSAGGTIVYGLKEFDDVARQHLPKQLDPVDSRKFSREWMDQIVGQISPRIEGVRITPVRVGPDSWHAVFVVEIPQSLTAHQARDFRYYRRYNFESVPMVDYEIRDVMNRRKHPRLTFRVKLVPCTFEARVQILVRIKNEGPVLARHYAVRLLVPPKLEETMFRPEDYLGELRDGFFFWRLGVRGSIDMPLFPSSIRSRNWSSIRHSENSC